MPTNQNLYNSRVTDESLEKKFRDTFTSQGGAELVSDLYAQGVIVPIVDFTSAASGAVLPQNLQTAWDFSTGEDEANNNTVTIINTTGFWQIGINAMARGAAGNDAIFVNLTDGLSTKVIWKQTELVSSSADALVAINDTIVVFVRSGDSVSIQTNAATCYINAWYRQIADVNGNLTNPLGFTSS